MEIFVVGSMVTFVLTSSSCSGQYSICNQPLLTQASGNISSPDYPLNYDVQINCNTTIIGAVDKVIKISFLDFDIESHANCSSDNLQISDGKGIGERFCGSQIPADSISRYSNVTIVFRTDYSVSGKGFFIQWSSMALVDPSTQSMVDETTAQAKHASQLTTNKANTRRVTYMENVSSIATTKPQMTTSATQMTTNNNTLLQQTMTPNGTTPMTSGTTGETTTTEIEETSSGCQIHQRVPDIAMLILFGFYLLISL